MNYDVMIYTQAGSIHGYGHIIRCSALYEEFEKRGFSCAIMNMGDMKDTAILGSKKIKQEQWVSRKTYPKVKYAIIDSYICPLDIYEKIAESVTQAAIYIDDNNRISYPKGFVVNPNAYAMALPYEKKADQRYLLGERYTILRKEFYGPKEIETQAQEPKTAMVTLGGSLRPEEINRILKTLIEFGLERTVVIGRVPHGWESEKRVHPIEAADAKTMSEIMRQSDIAISGAGQILHELIKMNVPTIAISIEENQNNNLLYFDQEGLVIPSSIEFLKDKLQEIFQGEKRSAMLHLMRQKSIINGTRNVVDAILMEDINIRNAIESDSKDIYKLRSLPYVRKYSRNKGKFSKKDHKKWFSDAYSNEEIDYYIFYNQNESCLGQVRLQSKNGEMEVSISLTKKLLGKGLSQLLLQGCMEKTLEKRKDIKSFEAVIDKNNLGSKRLFEKSGFLFEQMQDEYEVWRKYR